MAQIIGFATEYYTLWDYNTESQYTTDAYGKHHLTGVKHNFYYIQNISKDLETVKAKHPSLSIDEGLRGKHASFNKVDKIELPIEYLSFGKYTGMLVTDVITKDFNYIIWMLEKLNNKTTDFLKTLDVIKEYYIQKELEEKERKGEPAILQNGVNEITILTNGRSNFHIADYDLHNENNEILGKYYGNPYMLATLTNDKGFTTNVTIILDAVKEVNGMYPYLMPIINSKAMKTKNKTLKLNIEILKTISEKHSVWQIVVIK